MTLDLTSDEITAILSAIEICIPTGGGGPQGWQSPICQLSAKIRDQSGLDFESRLSWQYFNTVLNEARDSYEITPIT